MIERMRNICIGGKMNAFARASLFATIFLVGCGTTRDVAVTSYHVTRGVAVGSYRVATAPVHYALRRHGESSTTTATETTSSDVTVPGQPMPAQELASAPQQRPRVESERVHNAGKTKTAAIVAYFRSRRGISHGQIGSWQTWIRLQSLRFEWKICRCKRLWVWQQSKGSLDR